jgi:hypothetical protein
MTDPQHPELTSPLARGAHAMVHMVPESMARGSWWWMVIRRGQPFNPTEQQLAGLMLRYWQVGFDQPDEPGMNRLLIGHDDRLILADVGSQAHLLRAYEKAFLCELVHSAHDRCREENRAAAG